MTSAATNLGSRSKSSAALVALLAILLLVAIVFVGKFVFHYYLNYGPPAFGSYWPRRAGLVTHITAGTVALLVDRESGRTRWSSAFLRTEISDDYFWGAPAVAGRHASVASATPMEMR